MVQESRRLYEFGPFRLDPTAPLLWREGEPVYLTPKALDTLVVLVERAGDLIKREELIEAVWPDTIVEENNLSVNISALRKALGEGYIQTVPRRGYRFTVPVRDLSLTAPEQALPQFSPSESLQPAVVSEIHSSRRVPWAVRLALAVVVIVVGIALVKSSRNNRGGEPGPARLAGAPHTTAGKFLVILPFSSNQSDGFTRDHTSSDHKLTAAVTEKLSGIVDLNLVSPAAVSAARVAPNNLLLAAHEFGADAVLTGMIFRNDTAGIKVRSHLVSVNGGEVLWAGTVAAQTEELDQLLESLALNVSAGLTKLAGRDEYETRARRFTSDRKAFQHYLQGRFLWEQRADVFEPSETTVESSVASVNHFEQARALDPNFALAYLGLADHYKTGHYASAEVQRAEEYAVKAIELAPQLAEPHATLGFIRMIHDWNWREAEAEFKRALELNPDCVTAHQWYALFHALRGNHVEAIKRITRARELAPYSISVLEDASELRYYESGGAVTGNYAATIEMLEKVLELQPGAWNARRILGDAYWMNGDFDKSVALTEWKGSTHGFAVYNAGPEKCTIDYNKNKYLVSYHCARWNAALSRREAALDFLERAYREHHFFMTFIKAEPFFRDLRAEPRFRELCRLIGLSHEFSRGIFP